MQPPAFSHSRSEVPVALPARWTRWQRHKNTAIYGSLRLTLVVLKLLPRPLLRPLAWAVGHAAWLVARRERQRALIQMQVAMPHLPGRSAKTFVRGMFVHLSLCLFELLDLPRLLVEPRGLALTEPQRTLIASLMQLNRGVVAVTGHIGNWELLAQAFAHAGIAVHTFAKPLYDPRLTAWVDRERRKYGLGVLWRGASGSAKNILRIFRRGEMLALLIDQDTQVDGCFVPFFGRPTHTPTAAASLALRFNAPILFCYTQRTRTGHRVFVEPIETHQHGDRQAEIKRLTAVLSARLQAAIEQAPAQWVWLHARWKQQAPKLDP